MSATEKPLSKYKAEVGYLEKEGLSVVRMTYTMDYEDWKRTFAENLKRYDAEKGK